MDRKNIEFNVTIRLSTLQIHLKLFMCVYSSQLYVSPNVYTYMVEKKNSQAQMSFRSNKDIFIAVDSSLGGALIQISYHENN